VEFESELFSKKRSKRMFGGGGGHGWRNPPPFSHRSQVSTIFKTILLQALKGKFQIGKALRGRFQVGV
jgi:hypothetical protein